jgi:hypothetical protein
MSERVTIEGIARNAKAGALLRPDDGEAVFIAGRPAWDEDELGTRMRLTGMLSRHEVYPPAVPGGQATSGAPLVLEVDV